MDKVCLPLIKCDGEENWKILRDEKIGEESRYGKIYQVCCYTDCDYVLKFQYYKDEDKIKDKAIHEINIHKHIYNITPKLVPKIIEDYECKLGAGIILEKLTLTLGKAIQIIDIQENELKKINAKIRIQKYLREMVDVLHKYCGIIHNDLHVNNIMCDLNEDYDEEEDYYDDMFINWKIIDFGESKYIDSYDNNIDLVYKANEDYYHINNIV